MRLTLNKLPVLEERCLRCVKWSHGQRPRSFVADQYPRRGAGPKGAYRRRDAINAAELAVW
jgi:hypothetical protein